MSDYSYKEIKKRVFEWSKKDIFRCLSKQDEIKISKNNEEVLIIDLTFSNCLAQITVSDPVFAPYQFVSFEAISLYNKVENSEVPDMTYFFYDTDKMQINEVMTELETGIRYCSNYLPNSH